MGERIKDPMLDVGNICRDPNRGVVGGDYLQNSKE
jgi:hypothetical protein